MKQPCAKDCPNRAWDCHGKCKEWLEYEKERNAEYERRGKEKKHASEMYQIERDRKRDIVTGKMKKRRNKTAFPRY